jgi:plastocyanin
LQSDLFVKIYNSSKASDIKIIAMLKFLLLPGLFLTSFNTLTPANPQCSHISAEVYCAPPTKVYRKAALISKTSSHKPAVWIVKMVGMRFVPRIIEIAAGDSIKWVNESNTYHNTVSADGGFISEMLKNGASFQRSFDKPGTFKYYCQPHRWMGMKGQIIVK